MTVDQTSWIVGAPSIQTDVALATVVVGVIVVGAGLMSARRLAAPVPGGLRMLGEMSLHAADSAVQRMPSAVRNRVAAVAVTVFWFVTVANALHVAPGIDLPSPTSDINLTLALAVTTMALVHATAIHVRGPRGYLRHYFSPWWLAPLKLLDELVKPFTLALRLFGMVFASALMVLLIGELLPAPVAVLPHVLWTLFDLCIGVVQAFIFALLTMLYFEAVLPDTSVPAYALATAREEALHA